MSNTRKGISTIIAGFFFFLLIGASYNWGVISDYYASYFFKETQNDHANRLIKLGVSLLFFAQFTTMCFDSYIQYTDIRQILLISLCLNLLIYFTFIFLCNLYLFFILMGLIGIANGIVFLKTIKNAWGFFPNYRGQISGVILSGSGLSSFFLNPIAHYIINPTKLGYDYKTYYLFSIPDRMHYYFIFLFFFFACAGLIGYYFTYQYENEEVDINTNQQITSKMVKEEELNIRDGTIKEGLTTATFYELTVILLSLSFFTAFLAITFPTYSRERDMDEFLVEIASLGFPFINGFGRNLWGSLADHFTFKSLAKILLWIQLLTILFIVFIPHQYVIFAMILMGGFCLSGVFGLIPPTYNRIFGQRNGTELFGVGMFTFGFSSLFCSFLANMNLNLNTIYFISGFVTLIGFLALYCLDEKPITYSTENNNDLKEPLIEESKPLID